MTSPGSITDEKEGFPRLKAKYAKYSDSDLIKEYLGGMKYCFESLFGQNAQKNQDIVGAELISRGIRSIPNIFGAFEVKTNWHKLGICH